MASVLLHQPCAWQTLVGEISSPVTKVIWHSTTEKISGLWFNVSTQGCVLHAICVAMYWVTLLHHERWHSELYVTAHSWLANKAKPFSMTCQQCNNWVGHLAGRGKKWSHQILHNYRLLFYAGLDSTLLHSCMLMRGYLILQNDKQGASSCTVIDIQIQLHTGKRYLSGIWMFHKCCSSSCSLKLYQK